MDELNICWKEEEKKKKIPRAPSCLSGDARAGDKPRKTPKTKHLQVANFDSKKPQEYEAQLLRKVEAADQQVVLPISKA